MSFWVKIVFCSRLFFECILKSISGAVVRLGAGGSGALDGGGVPLRVTRVRVFGKEISYA